MALLRNLLFLCATLCPLTTAPAAAYDWTRTLHRGHAGEDVRELQVRIAGWAAECPQQVYLGIDGQFGPATEAALRRFQNAYRLPVTGTAGPETHAALNWLEGADGSTRHFAWSEFQSKDGSGFSGGKVPEAEVRENVRRLMYRLEALRKKIGDRPVRVNSGFRSVAHNTAVGGASNSMHMYGVAADVVVTGLTTAYLYPRAQTCGFSGLDNATFSYLHLDTRREHAYGSQFWWWASGAFALEGCLASQPQPSHIVFLFRAAGGLSTAGDYIGWDLGPNPSPDPRGFGDGGLGLADALRALRRRNGLEPHWP
jgi:zinc D-Ala-D-Ala carboxypeptidase